MTALEVAQVAGVRTVFDLVPHNLPSSMPRSHVDLALEHTDIAVSEARTVIGISEETWPIGGGQEGALFADRASAAARAVAPAATWLLRYGFEHIGDGRLLRPDGFETDYCTTYQQQADRHLFGDRLLVQELHSMLVNLPDQADGRSSQDS